VRHLTPENLLNERILLVGSTNAVSKKDLIETLSPILHNVPICLISVPLFAPTSQDQAITISMKYWPTVYKKSNPFGPHPSIISRAEEEIRQDVWKWMDIAAAAARQSKIACSGEEVGVVVVDRREGVARPIAVAGDARWVDWLRVGNGNVTAHAAMRAIAMVAGGLKLPDEPGEEDVLDTARANELIFRDQPRGVIEREYHNPVGAGEGYLCQNLEIYCTHEPCVMCSMAIVHSRFGKVVFGQRMPNTGGLYADSGLGHGLFWRKELNWTMLAWELAADGVDSKESFNGDA
jgi:tRNA-specific adenosine deaminase 3